jgi:hypothetical protein
MQWCVDLCFRYDLTNSCVSLSRSCMIFFHFIIVSMSVVSKSKPKIPLFKYVTLDHA